MVPDEHDQIEELLADALATFDASGEAGLNRFLAEHAAERAAIERGLARCRQMGLMGASDGNREFPDRLGEFRLLRRLGSGGMGVVYEAEQQSLERRVALKVVRPELLYFEGARERFRREIEAVARLSHPAIVPVLASGEQDGLPWYAMELLHGCTVHELCAAFAARDPAALRGDDVRAVLGVTPATGTDPLLGNWWQIATRIVHSVALGVRHAHLRGIVHRDIKPSNIMLTQDGRSVLLDFGIAMVGGSREFTRTGNTPGSPAFMSPEQLRGDAVDERTDIYSLAATLWQLLTLVPPFAGVDDLQRIRDGAVPNLRALHREVPVELALVIETAMDRDRERRYADIEAFANDLGNVLQRRPIVARRLGLALRAWRWCQRHRVMATLLVALLVLAATLPGLFAWSERAVNRQLQVAVTRADDNFGSALDAIDKMLVTLANERLRFVPQAEAATLEALQHAAAMYRTLLSRDPEHARLQHDACKAMSRLAATLVRTGDHDQALATYEEAVRIIGDSETLDTDLRLARGSALLNLASLHKEHQGHDRMRTCLERAERDYTIVAEQVRWRSSSLFGLGQVANLRTDLPEVRVDAAAVERQLQEAVARSRAALELRPDEQEYQAAVVRFLDNLATHHSDHKQDAEAEPLLDEALALVRTMPAEARVWPTRDVLESDVLETLGNLYVRRKDPRTAGTLTQCIDLRERAVGAHPDDIDLRTRLGGAMHNLARTCCATDATDADLERALELLLRAIPMQREVLARSPLYERARLFLTLHLRLAGNCYMRLGRRLPLEQIAEELASDVGNSEHQRAVARFWLRAATMRGEEPPPAPGELVPDYRRQALQALLRAEAAGWRGTSRLTEAVYEPLAEMPDFLELRRRVQQRLDEARSR